MRLEKKNIGEEYLARLNASPFFIVTDYQGIRVQQFAELRERLAAVQAEVHVIKNSIFNIAAKDAGVENLGAELQGQLAVVTGSQDISAAAKILKNFQAEFDKPKIRFGFLGDQRLTADEVQTIADLPSLDVLRGKLVGVLQAPAQKLAALLSTPGTQVVRVLQARIDKDA